MIKDTIKDTFYFVLLLSYPLPPSFLFLIHIFIFLFRCIMVYDLQMLMIYVNINKTCRKCDKQLNQERQKCANDDNDKVE